MIYIDMLLLHQGGHKQGQQCGRHHGDSGGRSGGGSSDRSRRRRRRRRRELLRRCGGHEDGRHGEEQSGGDDTGSHQGLDEDLRRDSKRENGCWRVTKAVSRRRGVLFVLWAALR
ncbi:hypothetical protein SORBI_3010G131950 [Sorghum bicolor]|uniref:Uncharacterized protein n=1 Tax=Sorghum bicolor TaxID=4558 RepID=A0A1W0VSR7_SORBI|nr:hypothetical protein SORBI_3010G131950 [Sorghum bicolor]